MSHILKTPSRCSYTRPQWASLKGPPWTSSSLRPHHWAATSSHEGWPGSHRTNHAGTDLSSHQPSRLPTYMCSCHKSTCRLQRPSHPICTTSIPFWRYSANLISHWHIFHFFPTWSLFILRKKMLLTSLSLQAITSCLFSLIKSS